MVLHSIGLPFAGDVMNLVVLMEVLSTANSGLYAATRMMWSPAKENVINRKIAATNKRGVPMRALCYAVYLIKQRLQKQDATNTSNNQ